MFFPMVPTIPAVFSFLLKTPAMTANRAVEVAEAAAVKRKATMATRVVTQLPQRLQMAKTPTTSSTTVAMKAIM